MEYTHNLKIVLLDTNKNIIEDIEILNKIKDILSQNNTHSLKWNGKLQPFTIKWDKCVLSEINQILMGDLFACPIYEFDSIILYHTQETISKINSKYIIKFYISRMIHDKKIDKNSIGFV
jgi:hypothetical protein